MQSQIITCSVEGCEKPVKVLRSGLCGMHDMRMRRTGDVNTTRKAPNGTPILERIARYGRQEGDCIVWTKARDRKGYGMIQRGTQWGHVTRALWEETEGPIPDGMLICHTCDNPPCFKRAHLYLGTGNDNMQDMHDRGRAGYRGRDAQPHSKFSEVAAATIRQRYARGGITQKQLANEYGCSSGAIWFVLHPGVATENKRRLRAH